jgi:hypothetical protein
MQNRLSNHKKERPNGHEPKPYLTPEEYLRIEREADWKSEFHDR